MKKISYIIIFMTLITNNFCKKTDQIKAPKAKKIEKKLSIHGHERIDNYFWLNNRDSKDVIQYLESENKYTEQIMKASNTLKTTLYNEIISRIDQNEESVPYLENGYYYYYKFKAEFEHPTYFRKKDQPDAQEEILLDVNELAKKKEFYDFESFSISPNNQYIAYSIDTLSRRQYIIYFKDLESGKQLIDKLDYTDGSLIWANDNRTVFYVKKDKETLREYQLYKHILGTDKKNDQLVFSEPDKEFYVSISKSKSNKYIFLGIHNTEMDEYRYLDANTPNDNFQLIQERIPDMEYDVEHHENNFVFITNYNAENFRIMTAPIKSPDIKNWKEIIPHSENILIQDIEVFKNYFVLELIQNGLVIFKVIDLKNKTEYIIDFKQESYFAWLIYSPNYNQSTIRYRYSSLTTPVETYSFNLKSRESELLKQDLIPNYNPHNYETKRLYAKAKDGTEIPISIVYKKGIKPDGSNPLLIYGYGAYGESVEAYFQRDIISLLDRGFIYAIAHIRGGEEMGRQWYENGRLLNKMNTFSDFISCTEFLQNKKYSKPELTFAQGGSAGGLLMGVIANIKPELYKGIIAQVPFVDIVTTMLDDEIPLTTFEYDEWGNPNQKQYYDYMLNYSPYDNVKAQNYPAMLITTGYHDSQVQYWEPAKWTAKLREMKTDNNILLFWINMSSGHGGASGRYEQFKETSLEFAFMINQLNR